MKPKTSILTDQELTRHLPKYFLATPDSPMNKVIASLIYARSIDKPVAIYGSDYTNKHEIAIVADTMGLEHRVVDKIPKYSDATPIAALEMKDRFIDFEMVIPFLFKKILHEGIKPPRIEVLSLLAWHFLIFEKPERSLESLIGQAVYKQGVDISFQNGSFDGVDWDFLYATVRGLPLNALLYLGLCPKRIDNANQDKLSRFMIATEKSIFQGNRIQAAFKKKLKLDRMDESLANHPINTVARFKRESNYPVILKRVFYCNIDDIGVFARNLSYLERHRKFGDNKVSECLQLRLFYESEESIAKKLEFESQEDYEAWLLANHIDISSKQSSTVMADWLSAKETLGIPQESLSGSEIDVTLGREREAIALEHSYVFRKMGDIWQLQYKNEKQWLKHVSGMDYVHLLLANPGQDIFIEDLVGLVQGTPKAILESPPRSCEDVQTHLHISNLDRDPMADSEAILDLRCHRRKLVDEIEANKFKDPKKKSDAQNKLHWIEKYLSSITSVTSEGYRIRDFSRSCVREINRVSRLVHTFKKRIQEKMPRFHTHLKNSMKIGNKSSYTPEEHISWFC